MSWCATLFSPIVAAAAASLPPLSPQAKILAFGDSLTGGVGGSGESYPQRLAQHIHREVINAGFPGETTAQGRARLASVLQAEHPELLILCLGTNDFLQGIARERTYDNLLAMLGLARDARVPVLLLALPHRGTATADPLFAEVAAIGSAIVDNKSMVEVLGNPGLKTDLVHPNGEGYRLIAENLAKQLRTLGALPASR